MRSLAAALVLGSALPAAGVPVSTTYIVTGATLQQCGRAGDPPVVVTCESAQPASVTGSFTVSTDDELGAGIKLLDWDVDIDVENELYEQLLPSEMYGDPAVYSVSPNPPEILAYTLTLGPASAHMEAADYLYTGTGVCTPQTCPVEFLRFDAVAVPEPTTALLAALGLAALGVVSRPRAV